MTQKQLHPSVLQFKEFVKNNPNIIKEVRSGKATWQELYEDWYLLGEEDKRWESLGGGAEKGTESKSNEESKNDWVSNIMGMVKKMDPNQMQGHINNLSQALGAIQGVISQFQGGNVNSVSGPLKPQEGPKHPFGFRKD
ncbi:YlbD family protein [Neobacillus cucumis]|uniref:YlbD family protein n=1 Tax=Neobacillus cucumis TaxID=1740721 RepID=UPI002E1C2368|nr:YlbD family protein [Neobacillus cucumis]